MRDSTDAKLPTSDAKDSIELRRGREQKCKANMPKYDRLQRTWVLATGPEGSYEQILLHKGTESLKLCT